VSPYEPDELVLTALAGTPMTEIAAARRRNASIWLSNRGTSLSGAAKTGQDAGGTLACNLSGPRRPFAGAARDHFLGFQAVNGAGEAFKAGGKVVRT
jgi:glycolate oxidase FAD binding subunit